MCKYQADSDSETKASWMLSHWRVLQLLYRGLLLGKGGNGRDPIIITFTLLFPSAELFALNT